MFRTVRDEVPVLQAFPQDHVHQPVQQGDIRAGLEPHVPGRVVGDGRPAGIENGHSGAPVHGLFHVGRGDGVVVFRIGTDHEDDIGFKDLLEGVGDRPAADRLGKGRHGRGVTEARAVVDVIGAEDHPDQFLKEVGLFIGHLGRAETRQRTRAERAFDLQQPASRQVQRLVPFGFAEHFPYAVVPFRRTE